MKKLEVESCELQAQTSLSHHRPSLLPIGCGRGSLRFQWNWLLSFRREDFLKKEFVDGF